MSETFRGEAVDLLLVIKIRITATGAQARNTTAASR